MADTLKTALWFITWKCNYKCPYCWETDRSSPFLPYDKLADAWNRLRPGLLDITGGEPFLQPGFISLLERLDTGGRVAITTNLSQDMMPFVERISPVKVTSMTLSVHPTQAMSLEHFIGRCLLLKHRGFWITVNFVMYPEQMHQAAYYKRRFDELDIRFHVDPYGQQSEKKFQYNEHELQLLSSMAEEDRKGFFSTGVRPVRCSAGLNHLLALPNGDVYRCLSDHINNRGLLGNLFSGVNLNQDMVHCDNYNLCAGCDRDKVTVVDIHQT
jgi:organic radical activating enzyme